LSLIFYHLAKDIDGLRALAEALHDNDQVQEMTGTAGVDVSNLCRANQNRTFEVFRSIFQGLYPLALSVAGNDLGPLKTLGPARLCDGSFLAACLSMAWATYRSGKNKVKIHLFLDLDLLPDTLVVTAGNGSERDILRQAIQQGVTYIFDRGYNCYPLFAQIATAGAFFITRLLSNAEFEVVASLPVSPAEAQQGVLADQLIYLGGPTTRLDLILRLVIYRARDGKVYRFLTNRFDLPALTICDAYHYRWQIELFFRWIKQYLQVKRFLGRSENAVKIQLYAALIAFLLLRIYARKILGAKKLTVHHLRQVKNTMANDVLAEEIVSYLASLAEPSSL